MFSLHTVAMTILSLYWELLDLEGIYFGWEKDLFWQLLGWTLRQEGG